MRNPDDNKDVTDLNWKTNHLFSKYQEGGARNYEVDDDGTPAGYISEGFLSVQHFIFNAIMKLKLDEEPVNPTGDFGDEIRMVEEIPEIKIRVSLNRETSMVTKAYDNLIT